MATAATAILVAAFPKRRSKGVIPRGHPALGVGATVDSGSVIGARRKWFRVAVTERRVGRDGELKQQIGLGEEMLRHEHLGNGQRTHSEVPCSVHLREHDGRDAVSLQSSRNQPRLDLAAHLAHDSPLKRLINLVQLNFTKIRLAPWAGVNIFGDSVQTIRALDHAAKIPKSTEPGRSRKWNWYFQRFMKQQTISNLASPTGRAVYQNLWHDLVIERRDAVVPSLARLWRTASFGTEVRIVSTDETFAVSHRLGLRQGTRLFMEEVVVRHYYNNVQALVYLGAVILLVFLGLRFAGILSEEVALIGIGVEAIMLLLLFTVLFYAPEESVEVNGLAIADPSDPVDGGAESEREDNREIVGEVLREIEEIGSTYASLAMKMEALMKSQDENLKELARRVSAIQGLNLLESHAERLETTNTLLAQLVGAIEGMNGRIDMMFGKEIEFHVRREIEAMVQRGTTGTPPANRSEGGAG